jgi:RNA polymerase sigma-70 factor (ECF subfamily)
LEQKIVLEQVYTNIHEDLIEACKGYDRKAQAKLYKLYYKAMYNTCLRIVNDPGEAEDIMQDSFLSAFEKIDQYSGMVSFGAWLKRIVINRSIDVIKRRRINFEEINEERHGGIANDEIADTEEAIVAIERIKVCMEKLADGYRLILSLYLFEGYDHEEIAEIMNITSSTSRSQFARAKKKLVEMMNCKVEELGNRGIGELNNGV